MSCKDIWHCLLLFMSTQMPAYKNWQQCEQQKLVWFVINVRYNKIGIISFCCTPVIEGNASSCQYFSAISKSLLTVCNTDDGHLCCWIWQIEDCCCSLTDISSMIAAPLTHLPHQGLSCWLFLLKDMENLLPVIL